MKKLFRTFRAPAFKVRSPSARVYNTVARQVPRSIASLVNKSSLSSKGENGFLPHVLANSRGNMPQLLSARLPLVFGSEPVPYHSYYRILVVFAT